MSYTIVEIIQELCLRAGLDETKFDVSQMDGELSIEGFMTSAAHPVSGALKTLSQIGFFDATSYDGAVHFVPRGGLPVAEIDVEDLVDDIDVQDEERRADSLSIPRVLQLNYHDVNGLLAPSKQVSERPGDRRAVGEVALETPAVLETDHAAQIVRINHKLLIQDQRGEMVFGLPDSYLWLTVGDVILLNTDTRTETLRIHSLEIFEGYQIVRAMRDRESVYTSDAVGVVPAPSTPPPSSIVTHAMLALLQVPPLRDADDDSMGYYVAVAGAEMAWSGARIELSYDGGANYVEPAFGTSLAAVMGEVTVGIGSHPRDFPDAVNTLEVTLFTYGGELTDSDFTGLLNRQNLAMVGDELIQFADAVETTPGVWELSTLLRGRRGTPVSSHSIGETFVLVRWADINRFDAELSDLGQTRTLRATSYGLTVTGAPVEPILFNGGTERELAPGYLAARRAGTDVIVEWQGVARLGSGANAVHGARFDQYRVTVLDGVNTVITDTAAETHTQGVTGWASPVTVRVAQLNDLTGAGPYAEVSVV